MKKVAIIGGGISGLSALHFIKRTYREKCQVTLFEKEDRLGGTIGTDRTDGFVSDWGPNGFLDKVPLTLELIEQLDGTGLLDPANSKAEKRFIYCYSRLNEIVPSPVKFMTSSLLSIKGRMRIAMEPFIKARSNWDEDETIHDFVSRRIGPEAAETLVGPMVSGIFGGDAKKLSLKACFPIMVEMEKEYGSLIKAMIGKMRAAKKNKKNKKNKSSGATTSSGSASGPAGRLTSFAGGLQTFIDCFKDRYDSEIVTSRGVESIHSAGNKYLIKFGEGSEREFDGVICAAPAFTASQMVASVDRNIAALLDSIPYASIAVVCLGYHNEQIGRDANGFGFLIPRGQGKRILGSIWTSSIFSNRCPAGMTQFRIMIGGDTDPEAVNLSDEQLLEVVSSDFDSIMNINSQPQYVNIFRYRRGIPQFVVGHPAKIERLDELLENHRGLYFTGNAYEGVGLNDCIVRSQKVVSQMALDLFGSD